MALQYTAESAHERAASGPAGTAGPAPPPRRWRPYWMPILAAAIVWAGMLVFLYPTIASWVSEYNQSKLIDSYTERVQAGDLDPTAAEQLRIAHEYNLALTSGALLEENARLPTGDGSIDDGDFDYWSLIRATPLDVMARLRIPVIGVDLPVYHGTSDSTLDRGVGHLQGTSLPVGGEGTHSVLTAHRGLAHATMFTNLDRVKVGDTFSIEVLDEVLSYRVMKTQVVNPDEREALRPIESLDLVTLVTCTPLGINTQRILVTAERVTPTPLKDIEASKQPSTVGFPWWIIVIAGGTALVGGYIYHSGLPPKSSGKNSADRRDSGEVQMDE